MDLTTQLAASLPTKYDDTDFESVASGTGFMPRLQLMTANSEKCKSGEFPTNHYAIIDGDNHIDMGKAVDVFVCAWRPMALDFSGDDVLYSHDPKSSKFSDIKERAGEKDSKCMYGPQYLLFVPNHGYCQLFLGSVSSRMEAPALRALMHKAATCSSKKIEGTKYTWFTNSFQACSVEFDLPSIEELTAEIEKFQNPKEQEIEAVTDETDGGREV